MSKAQEIMEVKQAIKKLEKDLSKGISTITHKGKTVTYRNGDDILEAIYYFKSKLKQLNGDNALFVIGSFRGEDV